MKTNSLKNRSAQWLAGSTVALTATHSDAQVLRIDLNHDLTSPFASTQFNGVGAASSLTFSVYASTLPDWQSVQLKMGGAFAGSVSTQANNGYAYAGIGLNADVSTGLGAVAAGLLNFTLDNGTEGWLHLTATSGDFTNAFVADYFVFDGANDQVRPAHGGNLEAFDGFGSTVTTTRNSSVVPEPSSLALLALGAAGVMGRRRRQAK